MNDESVACRYVVVGRKVVALRPISLYSIDEITKLDALLEQVREKADALPVSLLLLITFRWHPEYRILRAMLKDAVTLLVGYCDWHRFSHLADIVGAGMEYLSESDDHSSGESSDVDIGRCIASLQKFYGGDQSQWYHLPKYQLRAYSDAVEGLVNNDNKDSVTDAEFAAALNQWGMEGVYS